MPKESPCSLVKLSMRICVLIKVAILRGSIADFCVFNHHFPSFSVVKQQLLLLKTPKSFTISHRNLYLNPFSTYFQWLNQQFSSKFPRCWLPVTYSSKLRCPLITWVPSVARGGVSMARWRCWGATCGYQAKNPVALVVIEELDKYIYIYNYGTMGIAYI